MTTNAKSTQHASGARPEWVTRAWHRLALSDILLLSAFMNFFRLAQEGFANLYYAAAVKSMLTSWHNFFFVSFDPGGFVTVDKPPLGLWIQTASAALLGFEGLSLLLPQALAGVLAVALLYHLVRRTFGPNAGLLAALILAVTPISVAANRNNTMDSVLVLLLLLAAWAALRAAESGRLRWLLLCATLVGLGFNVKMLQAFLVLPALYLLYLVAPPLPWWKRLLHLGVATVVLLAVSLSWAVIVDLTPPEQRPYIGSSQDNTVMELIIGHNGLKRLLPGGLRSLTSGQQSSQPSGRPPPPCGQSSLPPRGGTPPTPAQSRGPAFSDETGEPGALRLFNRQLAGQISWLLPLAGLGLIVAAAQERFRLPLHPRHQAMLLWAVWLLVQVVFFSVANLFHRYYLNMLAPAIAALVGAGVVALWKTYRRPGWRASLLPLALLGSAVVQAHILAEFPEWSRWLTPIVVGGCLATALALAIAKFSEHLNRNTLPALIAAAGVLALLVAPTVWALIPVWHGGHSGLPFAGPDLLTQQQPGQVPNVEKLVQYLENQHSGEFLLATLNTRDAAPIILATGKPVMALGGFTGGDPILTEDELAEYVTSGRVRFFLLTPGARQQRELTQWVAEHSTPVAPQLWLPGAVRRPDSLRGGIPQLFDAQGRLASAGSEFASGT